jgi:hypothetical protein
MTRYVAVTNQYITVAAFHPTTGAPVSGKVAADFGVWYRRGIGGVSTQVTPLTDLADEEAAHSDGGVIETRPGKYRIDMPDATWGSGVSDVATHVTCDGARDMDYEFELVGFTLPPVDGLLPVNVTHLNGDPILQTGGRAEVQVNSFATDSINAAAVNADAVTKVATGVWALGTRTLTSISALATEIRAALGLTTNNLDTQLTTVTTNQTTINNNILAVLARMLNKTITVGIVQADGGNSVTQFKTNLTEASNEHWKESFVQLTSGTLDGAIRKVDSYNGTTKIITVTPAWPSTPANAVTFAILNR